MVSASIVMRLWIVRNAIVSVGRVLRERHCHTPRVRVQERPQPRGGRRPLRAFGQFVQVTDLAFPGVAVVDRYGQMKANPLIETERSCKILFLRSIRELGLDIEEPESPRPPTIQGRA